MQSVTSNRQLSANNQSNIESNQSLDIITIDNQYLKSTSFAMECNILFFYFSFSIVSFLLFIVRSFRISFIRSFYWFHQFRLNGLCCGVVLLLVFVFFNETDCMNSALFIGGNKWKKLCSFGLACLESLWRIYCSYFLLMNVIWKREKSLISVQWMLFHFYFDCSLFDGCSICFFFVCKLKCGFVCVRESVFDWNDV